MGRRKYTYPCPTYFVQKQNLCLNFNQETCHHKTSKEKKKNDLFCHNEKRKSKHRNYQKEENTFRLCICSCTNLPISISSSKKFPLKNKHYSARIFVLSV